MIEQKQNEGKLPHRNFKSVEMAKNVKLNVSSGRNERIRFIFIDNLF